MSAAHLQQRSSQSHSPTQRAFMMTLSRSFLLTERVRARSPTSASDDATALSDQRRCMASCRCLCYTPPLSLSLPPLSNAQGEKCLYFPSKYYREREARKRFILTFYIDNLFHPFRMKNAYCMTGKHAGKTE